MFNCSHRMLINIAGCIWLLMGFFLLQLGLNLIIDGISLGAPATTTPLLAMMGLFFPSLEVAAFALVAIALVCGHLKGRYVLARSAHRSIARVLDLPAPIPLYRLYSRKYYLLLGGMMFLGLAVKFLGIPQDIRGAIDTAIGAALVSGAFVYFSNTCAARQKI